MATHLEKKYIITKADGSEVDPEAVYIVLRVDKKAVDQAHARASREAVKAYSRYILRSSTSRLHQLGIDLFSLIRKIEQE